MFTPRQRLRTTVHTEFVVPVPATGQDLLDALNYACGIAKVQVEALRVTLQDESIILSAVHHDNVVPDPPEKGNEDE